MLKTVNRENNFRLYSAPLLFIKLLTRHPIILVIIISTLFLFWKLNEGSLLDWDEAIYAQVAKEMVQNNDWLTPHYERKYWFHKPPLFIWATVIFYKLFGVTEFWSRAASALFGVGLLIVTYFIGKSLYDRTVGLLSVLILLTSYGFISQARFGTMDVMLTFFIFAAIYAHLMVREGRDRWWYLLWSSCALAVMTKGFAGIIAPFIILIALILEKRFSSVYKSKHFWLGLFLAFVIVMPWHILMYIFYGHQFLDQYFFFHILKRSTIPIEGHLGERTFYLDVIRKQFSPWFYLLPFALALSLKNILEETLKPLIILLLTIIIFFLYTLVQTKLPWYVVPIYPALSILVAHYVMAVIRYKDNVKPLLFAGMVVGAFVTILYSPIRVVVVFGFLSIIVLIYSAVKGKIAYHLLTLSILIFFVATSLAKISSLYHKKVEPIAYLAQIAATNNKQECLPLIIMDKNSHSTPLFYSNRPIVNVDSIDDLVLGYNKRHTEFEIILPKTKVELLVRTFSAELIAEFDDFAYVRLQHR